MFNSSDKSCQWPTGPPEFSNCCFIDSQQKNFPLCFRNYYFSFIFSISSSWWGTHWASSLCNPRFQLASVSFLSAPFSFIFWIPSLSAALGDHCLRHLWVFNLNDVLSLLDVFQVSLVHFDDLSVFYFLVTNFITFKGLSGIGDAAISAFRRISSRSCHSQWAVSLYVQWLWFWIRVSQNDLWALTEACFRAWA
jgi:hypothetical protein